MASSTDLGGGKEQEVSEDDVLYDDRRERHYLAVRVADDGVTLRSRDMEYYIPHTVFAEWYDPTRVARNGEIPATAPDWLDAESSP